MPWMETEDQLRQAVAFARYPPEGCRGIGGERATGWGECLAEHTAEANDHVLVVPIIESVRAIAAVPRMCQVEGVDVFFFGPADFSSTAGFRGQWEGPGVARQILELKDTIRQAGKQCGVVAKGTANLAERFEQGFRMLALGLDGGLLLAVAARVAGRGRPRPQDPVRVPCRHRGPPGNAARMGGAMSETQAIPGRADRRLFRGRWVDEISRHRLIGLRGTAAHRMGQVSRAQDPDRGRPGRRCARGDRADAVGHGGDGFPEPRLAGGRPLRRRVRRGGRGGVYRGPMWSSSSRPARSTGPWRRRLSAG